MFLDAFADNNQYILFEVLGVFADIHFISTFAD